MAVQKSEPLNGQNSAGASAIENQDTPVSGGEGVQAHLSPEEKRLSEQRRRRGRRNMLLVLAVCLAPVVASYLSYYVIKPTGRTNYGELLQPQREMSAVKLKTLAGEVRPIGDFSGRWIMVAIDSGSCEKACQDNLYSIRQVRLTAGKERDRVERLLLLSGSSVPDSSLLEGHEGMVVARLDSQTIDQAFPAEQGRSPQDHLYMIDPRGNLMMRYPVNPDPNRMKKDLAKLLRASQTR